MNLILIIALVVIPILLGIFRSSKETWIAILVICLALVFLNIDKFKHVKGTVKGASFEAELKTVVDEANVAIEQLKELGLALSSPIVDEMAVSGRMLQYIHLKYKLDRVANIADTLNKLGASQEEIEGACSTLYVRITNDHIRRILSSLKSSNLGKEELFEGINDGKMDDWDKARIETFIREQSLNKSKDTDEWFLDLDYFLKQRKLRREDKWQS